MDLITLLIDFILHVDKYIYLFIQQYGVWTYIILFLIIYCETGLVVFPFLPGDSMLFVVGALAATGAIDLSLVTILLIIAAVGGNMQNYHIGRIIGTKAYEIKNGRFFKREYLLKTRDFYAKHGGKAIVISRFMPIIRTFAPFIAGIGRMNYWKFLTYNVIGGVSWIVVFITGGYLFGNIPAVKDNFTIVIFTIIIVSLLPSIVVYIKSKLSMR